MTCRYVFFLVVSFFSSSVQGSALEKLFDRLGSDSTVTAPGGFQDQASGYYTGGSVLLRQKSHAVSPLNLTLPQVGAGCQGLDLTFGSISFIKAQELVELLRRMGSAVPTYAFQLALKTMAPQVENLTSSLRKMVQDMNGLLLDSCQSTQALVGGLWPRGTAASEMICQESLRNGNTDWFGARKHCQEEGTVHQRVEETRARSPDLMQGAYNLTWHVLQKMPEYKDNPAFCQFVLTTVGSVVSRKDGSRFRVDFLEGKGDQQDYLTAYLKGGQASLYVCDEPRRCLSPRLTLLPVTEKETLSAKTAQKIHGLWIKYTEGKGLTSEEKAFLTDASHLPLYKYIQVSAAVGTPFIMNDACDYIAITLLLSQMERIASEVLAALESLAAVQLEASLVEKFKKKVQGLRLRLHGLQSQADALSIWRLNQMIASYEHVLAARYSS